jgi:hypothetical protein
MKRITLLFFLIIPVLYSCRKDKILFQVNSPDNRRTVKVILRDDRFYVVEQGNKSEGYEDMGIDPPVFSPDGNHLAYVIMRGTKKAVVLDKHESKAYFDISSENVFDSPNVRSESISLKLLNQWLTEGKGGYLGPRHMPLNGGKQLEGYVLGKDGLVFSTDSKRLAYSIWKNNDEMAVVVDGHEGPVFDRIAILSFLFSPNSKKYSYIGIKKRKYYLVVNQDVSKDYETIGSSGCKFDNEWTEVTFRAQEAGEWKTITLSISK